MDYKPFCQVHAKPYLQNSETDDGGETRNLSSGFLTVNKTIG